MLKRAAIVLLFLAVLAIAVIYAWTMAAGTAPAWAPGAFAIATAVSLLAIVLTGIAAPRPSRALLAALIVTFLLVAGGFIAALTLPGAGEPLLLGIPRRAAIVLYGVGLLPVLILPVAYAATFRMDAADEQELRRIRDSIDVRPDDGT